MHSLHTTAAEQGRSTNGDPPARPSQYANQQATTHNTSVAISTQVLFSGVREFGSTPILLVSGVREFGSTPMPFAAGLIVIEKNTFLNVMLN